MKINYQIMTNVKDGKYIPDYDALIAGASCEAEKEYIRKVQEDEKRFAQRGMPEGFTFNMVYITKQSCGHFEIFQTPCNKWYTLEDNLEMAAKQINEKCSSCISEQYSHKLISKEASAFKREEELLLQMKIFIILLLTIY